MNELIKKTFVACIIMHFSAYNLFADDCKFLRYVTYCELKNNKISRTDTVVVEVYNREGEEYTDITIRYSKNEKISGLDGWIEDASGRRLQSLKKSDVTERNEISDVSLYADDFVRTFKLKHNIYPYKVCYTYNIASNVFSDIIRWSPVILYKISTADAKLVVSLPLNYGVRYFSRNISLLKSDTINNIINSTYKGSYNGIDQKEIYAEPLEDIMPIIVIVPKQFNYGIEGSTENWREYGNWFYSLNKELDELPESEKVEVKKQLNGVTDNTEKIKILYHYMQDNTRYINVRIGIGGLKAYPATYVARNKYGDCKALTNYMKALLKFAGIKSYFVLLNLSAQPGKIIEELPFQQFNHIILQVPLEKDTIWLENTSNTEPFRYVSSSIQNRRALLIDERDSKLISMPTMGQRSNEINRKLKIDINFYGYADAQLNFSFKGKRFEYFNELHTILNKEEQDEIIRNYMPFVTYDVKEWKLNRANRDTASIELAARLNLHDLVKKIGSESYLNILPTITGTFTSPNNRKFRLQLPYPIFNVDSIIYNVPLGSSVKSIPQKIKISGKYGNYEFNAEAKDNVIHVSKSFELFPGNYTKDEYNGFYEFISSVIKFEKHFILLTN